MHACASLPSSNDARSRADSRHSSLRTWAGFGFGFRFGFGFGSGSGLGVGVGFGLGPGLGFQLLAHRFPLRHT
eukprot:scaffold38533_cov55-Phaeocystis_antarctica.AAC.3